MKLERRGRRAGEEELDILKVHTPKRAKQSLKELLKKKKESAIGITFGEQNQLKHPTVGITPNRMGNRENADQRDNEPARFPKEKNAALESNFSLAQANIGKGARRRSRCA